MCNVGDSVVYGGNGVMTVVDVRVEVFEDTLRKYYVLSQLGSNSSSLIFVPIDNERLISMMHPLLSKDEIFGILRGASSREPIRWVKENRARSEFFKSILESGDRADIVDMIIAISEMGKLRLAEGKKNFVADENIKQRAEKLLISEISLVMNISEEEAIELLKKELCL